jgi:hypothetical protein
MVLSVEELWVGYMEGVEGVCVVVNQGKPTQLIMSLGMWTALMAGAELTKRAGQLILESLVDVPKATAEEVRRMNS